ncbi:hypothetical protein PVAND_000752 [Polypedilum vanderplanki]|uniref:Translation initiation factor 3 N-terminal domain-containing protein n=1 Tax=Polypedilum vanderplanki TaxID=319348 RepID=A0A9J6BL47_POLVA|nr:hypothetical protein PVAND_000752 [Polypedilum vanderplanki]
MNKIISAILIKNNFCALRTVSNFNNLGKYAFYCTSKDAIPATGEDRKKTKPIPKITLIDTDQKMSVITMEQARKIADKRNLKLINIVDLDTKSSRPVYKLMSSHEYHAEELKRREEKKFAKSQPQIKSEKLLSIGNKITDHDLMNGINRLKKWILKMHEVRTVISFEDGDVQKADKIYAKIEKEMKPIEGRVLQKRVKGNEIRFTVMPTIKKSEQHVKGSTEHDKKFLEPNNMNVQQVRSAHLI